MALWKPFRGKRAGLDAVAKHDGWIYFTTDDASLFFDYEDTDGNLQRKQLNAYEAEKLAGYAIASTLNASESELATSKAIFDAIAASTEEPITADDVNEICGMANYTTMSNDYGTTMIAKSFTSTPNDFGTTVVI